VLKAISTTHDERHVFYQLGHLKTELLKKRDKKIKKKE
jgi:hypothetical protein